MSSSSSKIKSGMISPSTVIGISASKEESIAGEGKEREKRRSFIAIIKALKLCDQAVQWK